MVNRTRPEYDDDVPARLRAARVAYEEALERARDDWATALAEAVDAGMSYREVSAAVGVSPTSISTALKGRG